MKIKQLQINVTHKEWLQLKRVKGNLNWHDWMMLQCSNLEQKVVRDLVHNKQAKIKPATKDQIIIAESLKQ